MSPPPKIPQVFSHGLPIARMCLSSIVRYCAIPVSVLHDTLSSIVQAISHRPCPWCALQGYRDEGSPPDYCSGSIYCHCAGPFAHPAVAEKCNRDITTTYYLVLPWHALHSTCNLVALRPALACRLSRLERNRQWGARGEGGNSQYVPHRGRSVVLQRWR